MTRPGSPPPDETTTSPPLPQGPSEDAGDGAGPTSGGLPWEGERHFVSAFEHAAISMALVATDGTFLKVNQAACEFWGYSEEELRTGSFQAITHPDDLAEDLRLVRSLLAGEIPSYQLEKRYIHRSGAEVWGLLSVSLLRDAAGRPRYFISQIQDITARKCAIQKLEDNAALLATVLNSSPDLIFLKDAELRTILCNEAFARASGKAPEELIGRTDIENGWAPELVFGDPAKGTTGYIHDDQRVLKGEVLHIPRELANVHGELRAFDTHKVPLRDRKGEITGVLGIARDITEREEAEARRLDLERQILHAQKLESLGVLAGGIAHDFNNLLTGILGHLSLIERLVAPASPAAAHVARAVEGAAQAAALTQQMLAYSGKGRFAVESVDLSHLIESMRRLIDVSASRSCRLDLDLADDLPRVEGDAAQLRQIVMNLIINAAEATAGAAGRVTIRSGARHFTAEELAQSRTGERLEAGRYVFCEVEDNGSGMPADVVEKIFDPFYSTKFTGRGLGLAAALGIVRGHRGALLVDSHPGAGSRFTVALPPAPPGATRDVVAPPRARPWRASGTALIIDDEETVRVVARLMLESLGFRVLTAASGVEGVELFAREHARVAIVLLDLTMPGLDGVDTLRLLREISGTVPVVLSSGYDAQTFSDRVEGLGLTAVLQKPYRLGAVIDLLEGVLGPAPAG